MKQERITVKLARLIASKGVTVVTCTWKRGRGNHDFKNTGV